MRRHIVYKYIIIYKNYKNNIFYMLINKIIFVKVQY